MVKKLNDFKKEEVIKKLANLKGILKAKKNEGESGNIAIKKIAEKLNINLN